MKLLFISLLLSTSVNAHYMVTNCKSENGDVEYNVNKSYAILTSKGTILVEGDSYSILKEIDSVVVTSYSKDESCEIQKEDGVTSARIIYSTSKSYTANLTVQFNNKKYRIPMICEYNDGGASSGDTSLCTDEEQIRSELDI